MRRRSLALAILAMPALLSPERSVAQEVQKADWRADWELAVGLSMEIDSSGFQLPSQVVFVPDPGTGPKDPLYFVVELKGTVKVVTNDRTVSVFASDFLPNPQGQSFVPVGSAGMCLDPERGYVFVTFAYLDETAIYRNGMVRFSSAPGTFGLTATDRLPLLKLFMNEVSATSHQIGPCQVKNGNLFVAVGYGVNHTVSQNIHSTLGSIIRMTTDFKPLPDNPFHEDEREDNAANYVWAYGFRNPFGLKFVGDRLFATENGGNVDRFNEIDEGENYLWDGTDTSIGARAAQVFIPSVGIVHLDHIPQDSTIFPEAYRGKFVAPTAGVPNAVGPAARGSRSLLMWAYDFDKRRISATPKPILNYRGSGMQLPVSAALGPDGLYFTALLPNSAGETAVYRIRHDPASDYPFRIGASRTPQAMINEYGCRQCHRIEGSGGKLAPALNTGLVQRLSEKLNAPEYASRVAELDKLDSEPYRSFREARSQVLAASGEERVRRWLPNYLRQPAFDNPKVEMPVLGLSEADAKAIAQYLVKITHSEAAPQHSTLDRIRYAVARRIPELRYRHLVYSFAAGILLALVAGLSLRGLLRRWRKP